MVLERSQKDTNDNRLIAAIGYIGILALVPLLLKKNSSFAQFHGKQGFIILVCWVINFFVGIFPIIGWIASFVITIALVILSVTGCIKALQGEYWEAPYIAQYAKKVSL